MDVIWTCACREGLLGMLCKSSSCSTEQSITHLVGTRSHVTATLKSLALGSSCPPTRISNRSCPERRARQLPQSTTNSLSCHMFWAHVRPSPCLSHHLFIDLIISRCVALSLLASVRGVMPAGINNISDSKRKRGDAHFSSRPQYPSLSQSKPPLRPLGV